MIHTSGTRPARNAEASGVDRIRYRAGPGDRGKLQLRARNNERKGQTALPTGIAAALEGNGSARVQVLPDDGGACFDGVVDRVKKANGSTFSGN